MRTLRARYRTPLLKESFRVTDVTSLTRSLGLAEYLRSAKFMITELAADTPLEARLAHYAQVSLAFVTTPEVAIEWTRNEASRARALLVFARTGGLEADTSGAVIRRGDNALLIPPGDSLVRIRTTTPRSELIYISAPAGAVPAAAMTQARDVTAPAVPWRRIAPLYAFVQAVCVAPPLQDGEPDLLAACSEAIVESWMRALLDDITVTESIVLQVRAFIEEYHANTHLTPAGIAEQFGIPMRTLQSAFAAEGSTVRDELRHARVRSATRLHRTHPALSQAQRAHLAGFPSLSAMYRALQSRSAHERAPADRSPGEASGSVVR